MYSVLCDACDIALVLLDFILLAGNILAIVVYLVSARVGPYVLLRIPCYMMLRPW